MNLHPKKRLLRAFAAATLFVWVMALIGCFLHCHYPGGQSTSAHSATTISPDKNCCASKNASGSSDSTPGADASCMAFKTITLNGKSAALIPPDLSLLALAVVFVSELSEPKPAESLQPVPFSDSSPPPLSLMKPALLSLPPPLA